MTRISENSGRKIVYVVKNILGQEVATIETTTDRAALAERLSRFEWGERFMKYIGEQDAVTGCLPWIGNVTNRGYGRIFYQGKSVRTHRLLYAALHGEITGLVMHLCNNRLCANPDHLKDGTQIENLAFRSLCGNYHGTQNHACKLSTEQVREVQRLIAQGQLSQEKIGQMFGIHQSHVSRLKRQVCRNLG